MNTFALFYASESKMSREWGSLLDFLYHYKLISLMYYLSKNLAVLVRYDLAVSNVLCLSFSIIKHHLRK
jgi:hypothetical protein